MAVEQRTLSFTIQGEFITNLAREKLFMNKDLAGAITLLRSALVSDQITSDEQLMLCLQVLHGAAEITGNSGDDTYGLEVRDDIKERPTDLSSISQLISDMADEIERLKTENHESLVKIGFLVEQIDDWKLSSVNAEYYNEYGKPLFSDIAVPAWAREENQLPAMDRMLADFLEQRKREDTLEEDGEPVCDYGWLEPDGTWHPVPWGNHSQWAKDWLEEHMPYKDHPKIYWRVTPDGKRHHIFNGDVLVYSLGWILMDSPHQGKARPTRDDSKEMTKAQKEFLYDYYIERGRHEEANKLYED